MNKNKVILSMMMVIVMKKMMMVTMIKMMMMIATAIAMDKFHMKQKRKKSSQELLASLRGQQADNISIQDLHQQVNGDQQDDQHENENTITPTLSGNNLNSSSSSNEANT
ncbi:hypothetical protein KY285_008064 [Solanum tuberosum]|nr:hypothetical protein KY285_008064 [Solanum tuberosum]